VLGLLGKTRGHYTQSSLDTYYLCRELKKGGRIGVITECQHAKGPGKERETETER
jgi:hypothetical protein